MKKNFPLTYSAKNILLALSTASKVFFKLKLSFNTSFSLVISRVIDIRVNLLLSSIILIKVLRYFSLPFGVIALNSNVTGLS